MKKAILLSYIFYQFIAFSFAQDEYVTSMIERNNRFTIEFYKSIAYPDENLVISPFGIANCLAMAYIGSEGETQKQMAEYSHFITPFGVLYSFKELIKQYKTYHSNDVNLLIGNSLWLSNKIEIEKKYKNLLKINFLAHVQAINMQENSSKNATLINRWIKKISNYNIRDLFRPESINPNDQLIYSNFVYLNGEWENPFDKKFTGKDDFYLQDSTLLKVDYMNQVSYLKYNENNLFQVLELPYSGKNISLIIILPKQINGIDSIENIMNLLNLGFWTTELYTKFVNVSIPKFKAEFKQNLVPLIEKSNCDLPFNGEGNFKQITNDKVTISKLIQYTSIDVSENKETNLTELDLSDEDSNKSTSGIIRFNANHPFIYLVKDNLNNSIILMGKLVNPSYTLSASYLSD